MSKYLIEVTDTFGGEANYSWVKRWVCDAKSARAAITKLAKSEGSGWKLAYDLGDDARYNLKGACICAFVNYVDDGDMHLYADTKTL